MPITNSLGKTKNPTHNIHTRNKILGMDLTKRVGDLYHGYRGTHTGNAPVFTVQ